MKRDNLKKKLNQLPLIGLAILI